MNEPTMNDLCRFPASSLRNRLRVRGSFRLRVLTFDSRVRRALCRFLWVHNRPPAWARAGPPVNLGRRMPNPDLALKMEGPRFPTPKWVAVPPIYLRCFIGDWALLMRRPQGP